MKKEPQQINQIPHIKAVAQEISEPEEILTPQEIKEALDKRRNEKRIELNTIAYNRMLKEEEEAMAVSKDLFYAWIVNKAKTETPEDGGVRNFGLSDREEKLYKLLAAYFTGDLSFCEEKDHAGKNYSLHKGLWLYGDYGCGKTTIAELFKFNPQASYSVVECKTIAKIYKDKGTIGNYEKLEAICFDDLGKDLKDGIPMHMGTKNNVMASIITAFYQECKSKKFRMHITTNLTGKQAEELYGGEVTDRLREMMNIISLEGIKSKRQ
jgi:hypothetical protein